jgi:hypothetical protein
MGVVLLRYTGEIHRFCALDEKFKVLNKKLNTKYPECMPFS